MDTCLSIGFVLMLALAIFSLPRRSESREVKQFIQMLLDALNK